MALDQNVHLLTDHLGACERIHKTPLPFAYMVHLRRALILFCFTLPFALVGDFGWGTIPDTLLVAYVFFGIEEIGVEIEDPFGLDDNDLPLERLCATIERDRLRGSIPPGAADRPGSLQGRPSRSRWTRTSPSPWRWSGRGRNCQGNVFGSETGPGDRKLRTQGDGKP